MPPAGTSLEMSSVMTAIPETTRQAILQKGADGRYIWRVVQAPVATVGDHQVLVHVRAASLQNGDLGVLDGLSLSAESGADRSGQIVCSDAAGDIVAKGPLVTSLQLGDRVTSLFFENYVDSPLTLEKQARQHGYTVNGVLGDYVLLEETGVAPIPDGFSYEEAATLPSSAITAWMATVGGGHVPAGGTVLVEGAGGVSIFALQRSKACGARVIITSSSDDKLQRALALGAAAGVNYKTETDWSARVLKLTDGHGADLVVDMGGKSTIEQSMKSLAYQGTVALVGGMGGYDAAVSSMDLILKAARACGVCGGSRADFLRMCEYLRHHQIRPLIDRIYPLDELDAALADLRSGVVMGKLVIRL